MTTIIKRSILSLCLILLISFRPIAFDFAKVLSQDREILQQGYFLGDTSKIQLFDKFTRQDISKFKYLSKFKKNHQIDVWTSNESKIIKVTSKIPVDTVIYETESNRINVNSKQIKVTFEFVTYQFIQKQSPKKLTYLTIKHEGLTEYSIDKTMYQISYVSTLFGLNTVYDKTKNEIMNILGEN